MAYNRSVYDRTAYNIGSGGETVYFQTEVEENITGVFALPSVTHFESLVYEGINANIAPSRVYFLKSLVQESIVLHESDFTGELLLITKTEEAITCDSIPASIIYLDTVSESEITAEDVVNAGIYHLTTTATETILADPAASPVVKFETTVYEHILSSASLEALDLAICYLNVTVKPGETLIVDANNYQILLSGQNAIEIQSGDWLDEMNRETVDISIDASSGVSNLTASILYTERYL